jgi:hypothetical protein
MKFAMVAALAFLLYDHGLFWYLTSMLPPLKP